MTFRKGDARPANSGRRKGSGNRNAFDVKEALRQHGPALAAELVRIALHGKNEATRTLALREALDRLLGKATQPVEGAITHGISLELRRVLEQHDGLSRSVPVRTIDMIEHDADGDDHGNDGSGGLH